MASATSSPVQSLDGGRHWSGLDGGPVATTVPTQNPNHGAGPGSVVGRRADVLLLANLGCCGFTSGMRLYTEKLTFTDSGWQLRHEPALVDCDPRHCVSNQSVIRLENGRLWAAYGMVGRLGYTGVNARYSDDDGLVWKSWREGRTGAVPGSFPTGLGVRGGCSTYIFEEPCLVPFGANGIACFWHVIDHYDNDGGRITDILKWSALDGRSWSPVATVLPHEHQPQKPGGTRLRPSVHAVSVGGKEIFLASQYLDGILRYDGSAWSRECLAIPAGAKVGLSGGRTVMAFALVDENRAIDAWRRSPPGNWTGPIRLVRKQIRSSSGARHITALVSWYSRIRRRISSRSLGHARINSGSRSCECPYISSVFEAILAGAQAYLLKDAEESEIVGGDPRRRPRRAATFVPRRRKNHRRVSSRVRGPSAREVRWARICSPSARSPCCPASPPARAIAKSRES